MSNLLSEIIRWAKSLKYWEQAILDKILAGETFTEETYQEIYKYLLEDERLIEKSDIERPALRFPDETKIPEERIPQPLRISKISNLQNVNALALGQTLTFGPQLTAIFGANASGKSGYSRVFGCAGFTRGDRKVYPNITDASEASVQQSADIEICSDDDTQNICYLIGEPCSDLSFCHIFDSTSVNVHLTKSNEFSFSPAGLENLTRLAKETDVVRNILKDKITQLGKPHKFNEYFVGEVSRVSETIRDLGPKTDLKALEKLATITEDDKKKTKQSEERLSYLKNLKVEEKIKSINKQIADLQGLKTKLGVVGEALKDDSFGQLGDAISSFLKISRLAKQMGIEQFRSDYFTQTGSDEWDKFVHAAKELARAETERGEREPYPQEGDRCLLCYQALSDEALDLIRRLWKFLEEDIMERLQQAENLLKQNKSGFQAVFTDFFNEQSVYYRLVEELNPALVSVIQGFLDSCNDRKNKGIEFITNLKTEPLTSLPVDGNEEIQKLISGLETQREDLREKGPAEEIEELEKFLMLQRHRKILEKILPEVKVYVFHRAWAVLAANRIGSTAHITRTHNELFGRLVKQGYLESFNGILESLDHSINVKIVTVARKGVTYKQVVLDKCAANVSDATPDKIFSEGEKRAVSIADFLAEVEVDLNCTSMVLDDPVTSFDLEWREKIAAILAKEATKRQVIVFTHDLAFLYHLIEAAEQENVDILCHWIQRGWSDGVPGYVSIDNSPAIDKSFKKPTKVQQLFERAKNEKSDFSERERLLKDGFGALRTCYEAFIIFDLFNDVVERFSERISFGRLEQIVWDESIVQEVINKYEDLSLLMEGHLHSTRFAYKDLTPDILYSEIQRFTELKKQLKELKKKAT